MGGSFSKIEIKKDSLARGECHAKVLEEPILVCSKTPEGITSLGVAQLPIVMTPCHLMRALRGGRGWGHGVPVELIANLPKYLNEPLAVYQSASNKDRIMVILDGKDSTGSPVVAVISMNTEIDRPCDKHLLKAGDPVNFILSVYGRRKAWAEARAARSTGSLLFCKSMSPAAA